MAGWLPPISVRARRLGCHRTRARGPGAQADFEKALTYDSTNSALQWLYPTLLDDFGRLPAELYAWRGEKDKAFEWLDRAYQQHSSDLYNLKSDFASLRGDARFAALLRKMNLPE